MDARIKREQEAQAELVIKEDEAAENGDTVVIDFEGFLGKKHLKAAKVKTTHLNLAQTHSSLVLKNN